MKTKDIRNSYLNFFKTKGHVVVSSDSLVPQGDPTLLFTGAGMNQFKENFLGLKKDLKRATSSQKCLRTGDLEEVGRTAFHHSFFEMLGNFSFGDYFKKDAIHWAWEYLTQVVKIPKERLRISVHSTDKEALEIWKNEIGIRESWIYPLGDKSNFWPANAPEDGPNGPCGPCSEIYFDQDPSLKDESLESPRFAEIWNLVFTQFDRQDKGKLAPLAAKNIDTGMGLERLACVLQGQKTNYEIDLFQPILNSITHELGISKTNENARRIYAIADHIRATVFCISDGVIPGNEGRGYVVRKLIRRALWHGYQIHPKAKLDNPFLYQIVRSVIEAYDGAYPELLASERSVTASLQAEEARFLETLDKGIKILEQRLAVLEKSSTKKVPGEVTFELYDTYGFPEELTRIIAETKGFTIDTVGFERNMEEQRKRAKAASQIADAIFVSSGLEEQIAHLPPTQFKGYDHHENDAKVLWIQKTAPKKGLIVLDQTVFYGEGGGQVGDQGIFENKNGKAKIIDTQKKLNVFIHSVEFLEGEFKAGDIVSARIDLGRRRRTMRNHTATHLLHAALRTILGPEVRQLGSLVSPDKLRFDFSYPKALTPEQIQAIEMSVNEQILENHPVSKEEKDLDSAKKDGALAFFGEKYSEKVRVVTVSEYSKELCGGTHCQATGDIGLFMIINESSVASGTRRIEAVTGDIALQTAQTFRRQINTIAQVMKTPAKDVESKVVQWQEQIKKQASSNKDSGTEKVDYQNVIKDKKAGTKGSVVAYFQKDVSSDSLRNISDKLRAEPKTIYLLATERSGKIQFLLGLSADLAAEKKIDLKRIQTELEPVLGITGGGRPDLIQGGGNDPNQLSQNWAQAVQILNHKVN